MWVVVVVVGGASRHRTQRIPNPTFSLKFFCCDFYHQETISICNFKIYELEEAQRFLPFFSPSESEKSLQGNQVEFSSFNEMLLWLSPILQSSGEQVDNTATLDKLKSEQIEPQPHFIHSLCFSLKIQHSASLYRSSFGNSLELCSVLWFFFDRRNWILYRNFNFHINFSLLAALAAACLRL